jgi:ribosomal protein L32
MMPITIDLRDPSLSVLCKNCGEEKRAHPDESRSF